MPVARHQMKRQNPITAFPNIVTVWFIKGIKFIEFVSEFR
jgi:hypothetical protein